MPPGRILFEPDDNEGDEANIHIASNVVVSLIEGGIDFLTAWGASGWARFADGGDEAVRVEAVVNGVVICEALRAEVRGRTSKMIRARVNPADSCSSSIRSCPSTSP